MVVATLPHTFFTNHPSSLATLLANRKVVLRKILGRTFRKSLAKSKEKTLNQTRSMRPQTKVVPMAFSRCKLH